jgi:hypothetical protein
MKKILIIILFLIILAGAGFAAYLQTAKNLEPSIKLIFPNGGEVLQEGSVYAIKWETKNIPETDKISINIRRIPPPALQEEGQEFDPLVFVNLENTGSADWKVSDIYPEGNYLIGITAYESIPVTNPVSDESDSFFNIKKADWQVYSNEKFGYSVNYPGDWIYREFPDTKTGAGFRPLSSPDEIASECVVVSARGTAENEYNALFDEYVKKAAAVEIQNFEKLNSIEPIITDAELTGYKTTWIYKSMAGEDEVSLPIAYFENKKIIQEGDGELKYKTVQISLEKEDCREVYSRMLSTFKLLK